MLGVRLGESAEEYCPGLAEFAAATPATMRRGHTTPSFFCRLVDDVVYWNTSFLSG